MSCILRVSGKDLAVDDLTGATPLKPYRLDRAGEPKRRPGQVFSKSCAHFDVSKAGFAEFDKQIEDAIRFLESRRSELRSVMDFAGVEGATLDFGIAWLDVAAQFDHLPPSLLLLAGQLGIGITISHYPLSGPEAADAGGT